MYRVMKRTDSAAVVAAAAAWRHINNVTTLISAVLGEDSDRDNGAVSYACNSPMVEGGGEGATFRYRTV